MKRPVVVQYGRYLIKAMQTGDDWTTYAYLRKAKQGSGVVSKASAASEPEVLCMIKQQLDDIEAAYRAARVYDEQMDFHVPSTDEYSVALGIADFTKPQIEMLKAHALSGERGMTSGELARSGGYADFSTANLQYGLAGKNLAEALGIELPRSKITGEILATAVIGAWKPAENASENVGRWQMYKGLIVAIEKLPL